MDLVPIDFSSETCRTEFGCWTAAGLLPISLGRQDPGGKEAKQLWAIAAACCLPPPAAPVALYTAAACRRQR